MYVKFTHGFKIFLFRLVPVKSLQYIALQCIRLMRVLVLLTTVSFVFELLMSKTMQSTFNISLCGGKLLTVKEIKKLCGIVFDFIINISNYFIVAIICSRFIRYLIKDININKSTIIIFRR